MADELFASDRAVNVNDAPVSVVIPSYRRGSVVIASVTALWRLARPPAEVIVVDQTLDHPEEVATELGELVRAGRLRWIRLPEPSIPHAMNVGLEEAAHDIVLFLDDDITPGAELVASHARAQREAYCVAGMVLQPGEQPCSLGTSQSFRFTSDAPTKIREFMGGNFSVRRNVALALGGFDENFVGAAYRFEAEFAWRYVQKYGLIQYEPSAMIDHLAVPSGGTRAHGHHLRTTRPEHSVGAYYFYLRTRQPGWWLQILWRPIRAVRTRHHLRHPWWIPLTLIAECRGLLWARQLEKSGPKVLKHEGTGLGPKHLQGGATLGVHSQSRKRNEL